MKSYTLPYIISLICILVVIGTTIVEIIRGVSGEGLTLITIFSIVSIMFYSDYKRYKREHLLRESKYKRLVNDLENGIKYAKNEQEGKASTNF
jgi:amino acid permease